MPLANLRQIRNKIPTRAYIRQNGDVELNVVAKIAAVSDMSKEYKGNRSVVTKFYEYEYTVDDEFNKPMYGNMKVTTAKKKLKKRYKDKYKFIPADMLDLNTTDFLANLRLIEIIHI